VRMKITVRDVDASRIRDVFRVCSHAKLDDPLQQRGMEIKGKWLLGMLRERGPCTKIAYMDERPVAQILFYPEEAAPFIREPRENAVVLNCTYNPFPEARGRGAARALIESLVEDCRRGLPCNGGRGASFIVTKPFNTGEGTPLEEFYARVGFEKAGREMFLELTGSYRPRVEPKYEPHPEDEGRAVMFYDPMCEWGYPFGVRVRELLHEIDPDLPVELIDPWQSPGESVRRGNQWLVVNATAIESFWTEKDAFRHEVERALRL
jgi:GNAT superfamily N-acetyltransferase